MQLGMIGAGRMGGNMVLRLMKAGHECVVYARHPQAVQELVDHMNKGWAYVNVHIFQDYGQGRRFCCPGGVRGVIWPDN